MTLGQELAPQLPFLRRYARALHGTQELGDSLVRATLEAIVSRPDAFPRDVSPRLGLYKIFEEVSANPALFSADNAVDEEDRLRPEFVLRVLEAVEAGDEENARRLLEPLHPADIADLIELAARDEREGLVRGLAQVISPDVLAELNDYVRDDLFEELGTDSIAAEELSRKVLLLAGLEGFSTQEIGYLVGIPAAEADRLISTAADRLEARVQSRVLVIARSPESRRISALLSSLGHRVIGPFDRSDSAELITLTARPGLVIADVNRAEAAAEVINKFKCPVVLLTDNRDDLMNSGVAGNAFVVSKPYDDETLKFAVAQALLFDLRGAVESDAKSEDDLAFTPPQSLKKTTLERATKPKAGPITATVVDGQLRLAGARPAQAKVDLKALDGLREDYQSGVARLADSTSNLGPGFRARFEAVSRLLKLELTEQSALRLANQVSALRTMLAAAEDSLTAETAADVRAEIESLSRFTRQFPIWQDFLAEAAETPQLSKEDQDAISSVAKSLQQQPDSVIAPELKEAIAEAGASGAELADPSVRLAFIRAISNPLRAIGHYFVSRARGAGSEFNKALEKELGEGLARGLTTALVASSTPLLALAVHMPAEFAWIGPILAAIRMAKK